MAVAFARLSGVVRIVPSLREFRERGGVAEAVLGIDLLGTSHEALSVLLEELNAVYITHTPDPLCTFHPKMYLFDGRRAARAIVGSHNLTSGGLETNYECGLAVDFLLPGERADWLPFEEAWNKLLPARLPKV